MPFALSLPYLENLMIITILRGYLLKRRLVYFLNTLCLRQQNRYENGEVIRIISAWPATKVERRFYEQG